MILSAQRSAKAAIVSTRVTWKNFAENQINERLKNEMYKFSGRPHWGQINSLTGSHNLVEPIYPAYQRWISVYRQLNQNGTFDSPFSKRVDFAQYSFDH